jgi:hypothetical protein
LVGIGVMLRANGEPVTAWFATNVERSSRAVKPSNEVVARSVMAGEPPWAWWCYRGVGIAPAVRVSASRRAEV